MGCSLFWGYRVLSEVGELDWVVAYSCLRIVVGQVLQVMLLFPVVSFGIMMGFELMIVRNGVYLLSTSSTFEGVVTFPKMVIGLCKMVELVLIQINLHLELVRDVL